MTKSIARGYAAEGILAFAVCPGFTMTGMAEDYLASRGGEKLLADMAWLRSFDPGVKYHEGVKPLSEIKVMKADPAKQVEMEGEIKKKYAEYFGL